MKTKFETLIDTCLDTAIGLISGGEDFDEVVKNVVFANAPYNPMEVLAMAVEENWIIFRVPFRVFENTNPLALMRLNVSQVLEESLRDSLVKVEFR